MSTSIARLLVLACVAGPGCARALADGGQVRVSETLGEYQLTVFTAPNPLRAGPVDVSVLLQRATSGENISDGTVIVELSSDVPSLPPIRTVATTTAATNKLLRSALVDLPKAGSWNVRVMFQPVGDAEALSVGFVMEAAPPLPAWLSVWPWFSWPLVVVLLFAIHRVLVYRRESRPRGASQTRSARSRSDSALPILQHLPS